MAKRHIFISYCHDNLETVRQLRADLLALGESVWWDQDILPGQDWKLTIRSAMKQSYAVILCLSAESASHSTTGLFPEAMDAIAAYRTYSPGSVFLIPVRLSQCDIPLVEIDDTRLLDRLQYLDLFPEQEWNPGLRRLVSAIRTAPEHPKAHAEPHVQTEELPSSFPIHNSTELRTNLPHETDWEWTPFTRAHFDYLLPKETPPDSRWAPIPCSTGHSSASDAYEMVSEEIRRLFSNRADGDFNTAENIWKQAVEHVKQLRSQGLVRSTPEALRAKVSKEYQDAKRSRSSEQQPTAWLLISGETGTGKTTLAADIARAFSAVFLDLREYTATRSLSVGFDQMAPNRSVLPDRYPRILILDALDKMIPGASHEQWIQCLREVRSLAAQFHLTILTARTQFFRTRSDEEIANSTRVQLLPLERQSSLRVAAAHGVADQLAHSMEYSPHVVDMAGKPLLLSMLIQMLSKGEDIDSLEDSEALFDHIIGPWLMRDAQDSIIPNELRLKCMQCLALHALNAGGQPVSYTVIDDFSDRLLSPLTAEHRERLNTDLRVCGFLRRHDPDLFEFQHALIYEYCVARTVFEDLKQLDFRALDSAPFTQEVFDFIRTRATRTGRMGEVRDSIRLAWTKECGAVARGNLLNMYVSVGGSCRDLSFDNMEISKQVFHGIHLEGVATSLHFRDCSFVDSRILDLHLQRCTFENCVLKECRVQESRFDLCSFLHTHWTLCREDTVRCFYCRFSETALWAVPGSRVTIHGGKLQRCQLKSVAESGRHHLGPSNASHDIRYALIHELNVSESLRGWRIEKCSLDSLSLFSISELAQRVRPSLSREVLAGVSAWKSRTYDIKPVECPLAAATPHAEDALDAVPLTKTQRRKRHRLLTALGRTRTTN